MLLCIALAQHSICTSDPYPCSQNFTYDSNSHFTLNATIVFDSVMDCCHERVSDPVWRVITNPDDFGQQVVDSRGFIPPGIDICTETSSDNITNIARVSIGDADTTFQIVHSFYADVDGEHHQQRFVICNFYYAEGVKYQININDLSVNL